MTELLITLYPWTKALHIVSVIAWMAGIFYLPRLFVHHVEQSINAEMRDTFQMMEKKLLKMIMNPASTPGIVDWSMVWPWTKALAVIMMTWFHHWLAMRRKDLENGTNKVTGRQFRMMNELPTLLMVIIVFSVVIKF